MTERDGRFFSFVKPTSDFVYRLQGGRTGMPSGSSVRLDRLAQSLGAIAADLDTIGRRARSASTRINAIAPSDPVALEPTSFAAEAQAGFDRDGFIEIPTLIPTSVVARLNDDLEKVLRGGLTDGGVADKLPKLADQQKRGATLWATSKPS